MVWSAIEPSGTGPGAGPEGEPGGAEGEPGGGPGAGQHGHGQADGQGRGHTGPVGADQLSAGADPAGHDHPGHPAHAGDHTRARILEVALELIADRGFAATSTREIAERLGFTKAALYYHFRTKDDLLAAIVGTAKADLEALIARGQGARTPAERRDLVLGYVHLVETHAALIRVLASDPSVKQSAGLHDAAPMFRQLERLLASTGDPGTAERTRVRAALTAVHGALVYSRPDDDPEVARATAFEAACAVLGLPAPRSSRPRSSKEEGVHAHAQQGRSR